MSFALVEFLNCNEVAVVPKNWLISNRTCVWPPKSISTKIVSLVEKGVQITPSETWKTFQVKILDYFETYAAARAKLCTAEYTSDLNTTDPEDQGRGKRAKRKRRVSSSSSSNETEIEEPPNYLQPPTSFSNPCLESTPKPWKKSSNNYENEVSKHETERIDDSPLFTDDVYNGHSASLLAEVNHAGPSATKNKKMDYSPLFTEDVHNGHSEYQLMSPRQIPVSAMPPPGARDAVTAETSIMHVPEQAYKRLLRDINILKVNQRTILDNQDSIMKYIKTISNSAGPSSVPQPDIDYLLDLLPIRTEADISILEEGLTREGILDGMLEYLKGLGSGSVEQVARYILRRIISDEEAATYSFLGQREKRTFKGTLFYKLVLGAVKLRFPGELSYEYPVDKTIQNWLRHAKARLEKRAVNNKEKSNKEKSNKEN